MTIAKFVIIERIFVKFVMTAIS